MRTAKPAAHFAPADAFRGPPEQFFVFIGREPANLMIAARHNFGPAQANRMLLPVWQVRAEL
ncbi:hypothetical protein AL035_02020 [Salipiger aestuarii]|nr:hypothetical protein AL035_02020 [Salipiger aestuarii]